MLTSSEHAEIEAGGEDMDEEVGGEDIDAADIQDGKGGVTIGLTLYIEVGILGGNTVGFKSE